MDTKQVIARFEAERQALAVMHHPNIAKVFDGGATAEGRPYFVMEYVRGEPITEYCDRVKMPLRDRLQLFAMLCDGLQHAHQGISVYPVEKRWDVGEPLARQTLDRQRKRLGPLHADTLLSLNNLQVAYREQGRYADAAPLAREIMASSENALGRDHPNTLMASVTLAVLRGAMNRDEEAEQQLQTSARTASSRPWAPNHPETLKVLSSIAAVYSRTMRLREAEAVALEAYEGLKATVGPNHPATQNIIRGLAKIYERGQQTARSKEWLAKLPQHP